MKRVLVHTPDDQFGTMGENGQVRLWKVDKEGMFKILKPEELKDYEEENSDAANV